MQNDEFVTEKLDRVLLHHKTSKNFKMLAVLVKSFQRLYFSVIAELKSEVATKMREEVFTCFQVIDYSSVLSANMVVLRYVRNNIDEV